MHILVANINLLLRSQVSRSAPHLIALAAGKVSTIALKYIGPLRQTGFFLLGFPDIIKGVSDKKVTHVVAGSTLVISGIFGLWSTLDYLSRGYGTSFNEHLFTASNIFFLISSILRLNKSIEDYMAAENRDAEISAMIGIGSNLYYIISACLMLFGPPTTLVIVLCCLGTATSFIQTIYDFINR